MHNASPTVFGFDIRDILFVRECPLCATNAGSAAIYETCDAALDVAALENKIFELHTDNGLLIRCASYFRYENENTVKLLFRLKKENDSKLRSYAVLRILSAISALEIPEKTLFVNVPRGRKNLSKYGFDQSAEMAKKTAKCYGKGCMYRPLLKRKIFAFSTEQKRLNAADRESNIRNKIKADKFVLHTLNKAKNVKNIVVIDDVITTGASIKECAEVLHLHFPEAKIYAASLAT